MSKLASVQKIISVSPIEGADKIEVATVLGWQIVVKKDDFKVGDLVCYIQIDTVMPELPEYEFLRTRKFRVRTIKLKSTLSQGLIVPLPKGSWEEGDDVTEIIGVKKYEKLNNNPSSVKVPKKGYKKWIYLFKRNILFKLFPWLRKEARLPFPSSELPKTDEERIQNIPQVLNSHKGKLFIVSYKLDGSSISILHSKVFGRSKFRICSRNFELFDKNNDWYKVFVDNKFSDEILKLVKHFGTSDIMVQGEAIGKFNGNHHNLQRDQIRLFNIFVDKVRISQSEFVTVCKRWGIPHCPVYKEIVLNHTMEEMLKISQIPDILNPNTNVEGLVWRSTEDSLSFKVINNNYLLKNEE